MSKARLFFRRQFPVPLFFTEMSLTPKPQMDKYNEKQAFDQAMAGASGAGDSQPSALSRLSQ
jgi:hypothetical protein